MTSVLNSTKESLERTINTVTLTQGLSVQMGSTIAPSTGTVVSQLKGLGTTSNGSSTGVVTSGQYLELWNKLLNPSGY